MAEGDSHRIKVNREELAPESLRSCSLPEFWQDEHYTCVDCGRKVLFTARKQQEWYEVEKRPIFERPMRCPEHFKEWRKNRHVKSVMDWALRKLKADPENHAAMRDAALAIVEYHQHTGRGNLQMAVRLLRNVQTRKGRVAEAFAYCQDKLRQ